MHSSVEDREDTSYKDNEGFATVFSEGRVTSNFRAILLLEYNSCLLIVLTIARVMQIFKQCPSMLVRSYVWQACLPTDSCNIFMCFGGRLALRRCQAMLAAGWGMTAGTRSHHHDSMQTRPLKSI
jgi:hypothetical protein